MITNVINRSKYKTKIHALSKFMTVGVFVTLTSMTLSFVFLKIIGTPLIITYILLYLTMIFVSFLLNSKYTFKSKRSIKRLLLYYGSYGISMLIGVGLLSVFRKILPFENWVLSYLVIPFTMLSNFTLSSRIFKTKND